MPIRNYLTIVLAAAAILALPVQSAFAAPPSCPGHPSCGDGGGGGGGGGGGEEPPLTPTYYNWMHLDVLDAFDPDPTSLGGGSITGIGSHLVILDNFGGTTYSGDLDGMSQSLAHGEWTSLQSRLVAPGATFENVDQPSGRKDRSGVISDYYSSDAALQVVNLSFGLFDPEGTVVDANYSFGYSIWDSLVDEAWISDGEAVFVKAAGNIGGGTVFGGSINLGFPFGTPHVDTLNIALIGAPNALFVGALDASGTIASYSTIAGTEAQEQYLVVRVDSANMGGLAGTSFAAPIVSGYAALIGDKYYGTLSAASNPAERVVDRLLETAVDTFGGDYDPLIHGVGEACLSCAISPDDIPG